MLRLLSKPATLALAPEGIAMRSTKGDIRMLTPPATLRSWDNLLEELAGLATTLDIRDVRFVLSSQFVRYAVLPWQPGVLSSQDWQALGEHHLRKLYGGISEAWEIRVALQKYGETAVVCAIDRALLSRLEEIATTSRWVIHGIEPALMTVFNHYFKQFPASAHWLLLAEPQRLLLAEITDGQWKRFSVASPPPGQEREECLAMIDRAIMEQAAQNGSDEKPAQLAYFGPSTLLPKTSPEGIRMVRLPQPAGSEISNSLTMLAGL